jgi:beta-glucosidase
MQNPAVRLGWATPADSLIAEAVALARKSDAALVFVGDDVSEGADRASLALPGDLDALIEAVAAANPRTVVVLNTVGPVLMPWLGKVAAVVEAWYPGEEDGAAIAPLLFGDADFGGRLPETFPASDAQGPGVTPATFPGVGGKVDYAEGLDVGYRFYDAHGQTPLFPFGFGLSYARFRVADLTMAPAAAGGLDVRVTVSNRSAREGADVAQIYLKFPAEAGEPPWQLKGFQRVTLGAGETRPVTFHLRPEDFEIFDPALGRWREPVGAFTVRVGQDSRDPGLQRTVTR